MVSILLNVHSNPNSSGVEVDISIFVDDNHTRNRVTTRSHTGIIIFCNMSLIIWYSKRQNMVKTSTFCSEFIAMKIAINPMNFSFISYVCLVYQFLVCHISCAIMIWLWEVVPLQNPHLRKSTVLLHFIRCVNQ